MLGMLSDTAKSQSVVVTTPLGMSETMMRLLRNHLSQIMIIVKQIVMTGKEKLKTPRKRKTKQPIFSKTKPSACSPWAAIGGHPAASGR